MTNPALVQVIRSGIEESSHELDVAVSDVEGNLRAWAGDPSRIIFARSCMKPLQAAVSLSFADVDLSPTEIAVMSSSHNAEPVHVAAVRSLLAKAGVPESALQCPTKWPWDLETAFSQSEPRRISSDCSGKHAGMLAACQGQGWDLRAYRDPDHPLQKAILQAVLHVTGLNEAHIGLDGCGVPVHGVPLRAMARMYASLSQPALWDRLQAIVSAVGRAMTAEPYMVGGRNRVDTALMRVRPRLVVKEGAEGLLCAGVLDRGLGVALKVRDGSWRAYGPGLIRVLELLGALNADALSALSDVGNPPVLGGDRRVGDFRASFHLTTA